MKLFFFFPCCSRNLKNFIYFVKKKEIIRLKRTYEYFCLNLNVDRTRESLLDDYSLNRSDTCLENPAFDRSVFVKRERVGQFFESYLCFQNNMFSKLPYLLSLALLNSMKSSNKPVVPGVLDSTLRTRVEIFGRSGAH